MTNIDVKPNLSFTSTTSFVGKVNLTSNDEVLTTYLQEFETPTFTKGYSTRRKGNTEAFIGGEMRSKTPISVSFIIDHDWVVYTTLLDIFNNEITIESLQLFALNEDDMAVLGITYESPSLSSISSVQFTTKDEGFVEVYVTCEFIYTEFSYQRIK